MPSPECFYLHLAGAQQGPYTIPQIDHLLNSGLIGVETLYWREGLDQWQPVTSLVAVRKKPQRWIIPTIVGGVLLTGALLVHIFGPVLVDGWQEANQHTFTPSAAYWRSRDVVRTSEAANGTLVEFADFSQAEATLEPPDLARVRLRGTVVTADRMPVPMIWDIPMRFNAESAEWTGGPPVRVVDP
jgi:hypothetical protein